jgi:predicted amidohydrolase/ribosomal protein S18 acetylase RimI-like enzyme
MPTDTPGVSEYMLTLRKLGIDDYEDVREIMDQVYPNMGAWTYDQFKAQINRFPDGQICIEDSGKVVAAAMSVIITYNHYGDKHTYDQITGEGYLTTHDPHGDTLYGVDIFVHPEYRGLRLGRRLYDARKELCENLNLRAIVTGGRIPNYKHYSNDMSPQKYIDLVKRKEVFDPILSFQISNDFHVRKVITNYLPDDRDSKSYATLLEWINIYYEEEEQLIGRQKAVVRLGVVQWQMRSVSSFDDLLQQVEYFVSTLAGYQSDFALFPEFFNGPLMTQFNEKSPADAIRSLAQYTEPLREQMLHMAVSYNINIISGSMPVYDNDRLYNTSYLCRRDGTYDEQYKLHITPDESTYWGVQGGKELRTFETDVGKVGILICYDAEFPELSRLQAESGINILFVPYWTDTKNAYLRVRRCAQARAIENECYVAISGSVGNLPRVENMDIQYSQAGVFSPSDFAFPHDGVIAEATPNTEMTLVADLDLDLLKQLRLNGSVTNRKDKRSDLFKIEWLGQSNTDPRPPGARS